MTLKKIVLDTTIISETLKASPSDRVIAWLLQSEEYLYLSAITVAELFDGAYRLPVGERRENLISALEKLNNAYDDRILPFDGAAAQIYARMQERARSTGRALTVEDGMIAAICKNENATLATRNTRDFDYLGIAYINPFEAPTPDVVIISPGGHME